MRIIVDPDDETIVIQKVRKASCFLCHSSKDKDFVRRLCDSLKKENIDVWFDEHEIYPGDSISEKLQSGIDTSDVFIVILSPAAISSNWVKEELRAALQNRLNMGKTIIPVLLEKCDVPPFLRDTLYIDGQIGFAEIVGVLATAINRHINGLHNSLLRLHMYYETDSQKNFLQSLLNNALQPGESAELLDSKYRYDNPLQAYNLAFNARPSQTEIVQLDEPWVEALIENRQLMDLSSCKQWSDYIVERYVERSVMTVSRTQGQHRALYSVPFYINISVFTYRSDLLEKYGADLQKRDLPTKPPWTWEYIFEVASFIADKENLDVLESGHFSSDISDDPTQAAIFDTEYATIPFMIEQDTNPDSVISFVLESLWDFLLIPEGKFYRLKDLSSLEVCEAIVKFKKILNGLRTDKLRFHPNSRDRAVFTRTWYTSLYRNYRKANPAVKIAPLPALSNEKNDFREAPVSISGEWYIGILATAKPELDRARKLISDLTSKSFNKACGDIGFGLPTWKEFYKHDPELRSLYSRSISRSTIVDYKNKAKILAKLFSSLVYGSYDVDTQRDRDRLIDLVQRTQKIISNRQFSENGDAPSNQEHHSIDEDVYGTMSEVAASVKKSMGDK